VNILSTLYNYVKKVELDAGLFGIKDSNDVYEYSFPSTNEIYTGIQLYNNYRTKTGDSACAFLFKRSFLNNNNLYFTSGIPYLEDGEFLARTLCLANKCSYN